MAALTNSTATISTMRIRLAVEPQSQPDSRSPPQTLCPIERYNDFGFTLGGPLFIPKVFHPQKDKTFFFWSEEWRKASTPGQNIINVPTPAELAGSFTSPIHDCSRGMCDHAQVAIHYQPFLLQQECYRVSQRLYGE